MSSGKGSRRREMKIPHKKYQENWNKIFKNKRAKTNTKKNKRED
tara:strand:+ start:1853 stop:1984 length:132 start_codon:yes stop_codon:yes gene_type:complete